MPRNIRIKVIDEDAGGKPRHATGKFFLRDGSGEYEPLMPDDVVEISDAEFEYLFTKVQTRAIEEAHVDEPNRPGPPEWVPPEGVEARVSTPATRERELQDAVRLMADDPSQLTAGGVPRIDKLCEVVGRRVTAKERDAAWNAIGNS